MRITTARGKMQIRKMKPDDYAGVYSLWTKTVGVGMRSLDDSEAGILKFLKRNPRTCFIAIDKSAGESAGAGGAVIGVILCGHDGRRGYIYHMAVEEERRRAGIGRRLVEKALQALRREGINKAALVAFEANEAGNRFWDQVGFTKRSDLIYRDISLNEFKTQTGCAII